VVNGASGARYCRSIGVAAAKIVVIPQVSAVVPASREELDRRSLSEGGRTLLYVGQLVPRKGVDLLMRAMANADRPLRLRVVGNGSELGQLRTLSVALTVDVEFIDWIADPAQLRLEYLAADYFVLPTLADEWGLVVVEALSQGTPVLGSTYSDAVVELVVDGLNGFTFRPDDAGQLAAAITKAADLDPAAWVLASAEAARSVGNITASRTAERFQAVILGPTRSTKIGS
jgi:glycosyltransferase involved in cell wall biosynthesis